MAAFEALSAIAGFLAVAYLVGSRKAIEKPFLRKKSFTKRNALYMMGMVM